MWYNIVTQLSMKAEYQTQPMRWMLCFLTAVSPVWETRSGKALPRVFPQKTPRSQADIWPLHRSKGFHRPAPPILPASSCMCARCSHVLPAPEEKWGTHFRRRLTCRRCCKNSTCLDAVWFFPLVTSTAGSEDGLAGKELLWVCLCEVTVRILLE